MRNLSSQLYRFLIRQVRQAIKKRRRTKSIRGRQTKRRWTKYKRNLTRRKLKKKKKTLENGEFFFSKLKALRDQGLRGRGSKKIKAWKTTRETYRTNGETLLNRACYLYGDDEIRKYSFETNERKRKGSRCSNGCDDIRERSQTNERRRQGYEITRPVVTTAVRRNPNKRNKKKGLWDYSTSCNDSCEKEPKRKKENEKGSRCSNGCDDIRERSQTNERRRKGYEFTRMVVMTTVREATRTNKDKHLWERSFKKDKHLWERSLTKKY